MSNLKNQCLTILRRYPVAWATGVLFLAAALAPFALHRSTGNSYSEADSVAVVFPATTPWRAIGGCGAGGSGSGTADGIQWLGSGVQGGLIAVEVLPRYNFGENFYKVTVPTRLSFKPTWTTDLGIAIPLMSKTGEVQSQSNLWPNNRTVGGIGDVAIDLSKSFGMSGSYTAQVTVALPTGQYDIKRGSDREMYFLPNELQKGSGLYSATMQLSRLLDVEDGFWKVDVSYTHPFAMKPFTRKNEMLNTYFNAYADRTANSRFYYRFKPYGENDLGGYTPPSVSLAAYFASRHVQGQVHSWGALFSAPFGVAWIPAPAVDGTYNPIPDPDHKAWSAALVYAVEFSRPNYPLLFAVSLPIHDRPDPQGRFNGPDWGAFLNQWTFACGFKTTLF